MGLNTQIFEFMFEFSMVMYSLTGCIGIITIIFKYSEVMETKKRTIRMALLGVFLIICGEFFSGFLRYILLNPLPKIFLIY